MTKEMRQINHDPLCRASRCVAALQWPFSRNRAATPNHGVVFVAYLFMGIAMPVLPLYVHQGLDFGTFVVGLVSGMQSAAALLTRPWAGRLADRLSG
jgi:MFS family permease